MSFPARRFSKKRFHQRALLESCARRWRKLLRTSRSEQSSQEEVASSVSATCQEFVSQFNQIEEGTMRVNGCRWRDMKICVAASSLFLFSTIVYGQDASSSRAAASSSPASEREGGTEIRALADLIRDLPAQVKTLNSRLSELRTEEQRTSEEARELRHELDLAKGRMLPTSNATLDSTPASVSQGYPSPSRAPWSGAP